MLRQPRELFWQLPPPSLPVRAVGAIVMDTKGRMLATCPNGSDADFIAWTINVFNGVHAEG